MCVGVGVGVGGRVCVLVRVCARVCYSHFKQPLGKNIVESNHYLMLSSLSLQPVRTWCRVETKASIGK